MSTFEEAKEKLRVSFMRIMNCAEIRIFGTLIYKFKTTIVDDPDLTAFVFFNGKQPCINFGMQLINRHNTRQITAIMLHEMSHFLFSHHRRGTKYNRIMSNMAADHVINELLMKDLGLIENNGTKNNVIGKVVELWENPTPFVINEILGQNYTFEAAYEWLMKNKVQYVQIQKQCKTCGKGQSQGQGKGKSKDQNQSKDQSQSQGEGQEEGDCPDCQGSNGKTTYKVKIKGQPDQEYTPDIDQSQKSGDDQSDETANEMRAAIRSYINAMSNSSCQRGHGSGSLIEFIEKLVKIKIPWNELLEIAIKSHVIQSFENKSWRNPRKRMKSLGFTLPGNGTETTASKLVICIDTSGSIGSNDLIKFLSICKSAIIHFEELIIIQHDYTITKITTVTKDNAEQAFDEVSHFEGRGGTSHLDVFKYLEDEMWHNDCEVGLVIMLTDYYSDINENYHSKKFNWINEFPIKIVINHSHSNIVDKAVDENPIIIREES